LFVRCVVEHGIGENRLFWAETLKKRAVLNM
jgi:hypothetical protein